MTAEGGMVYNPDLYSLGLGKRLKTRGVWVVILCLWPTLLSAQRPLYLGALGGVATLSGDGRSSITDSAAATSLYDPKPAYPVGCQSRYWVSPLTTVEHLVSGC